MAIESSLAKACSLLVRLIKIGGKEVKRSAYSPETGFLAISFYMIYDPSIHHSALAKEVLLGAEPVPENVERGLISFLECT